MDSEVKTKKRARRKQTRPLEIMNAAIDVFINIGYGSATFEDIASAGDFSRSTIYLYFKSKEEILRAYVHDIVKIHREKLENARILEKAKTQAQQIRLLLSVIEDFFSDKKCVSIILMLLTESRENSSLANIWVEEVMGTIRKVWEEITGTSLHKDKKSEVSFLALISPFLTKAMIDNLVPEDLIATTTHDLALILPAIVDTSCLKEEN